MQNWRNIYWKLFNFLARIVGVLFLAVGLTICIYTVIALRNSQLQPFDAWVMIISTFVVAVLGLLLIIARPYKPKCSGKERDGL